MVKIHRLQKSFKKRSLFENFNLEIEKGESVAIMGKSGTGKTTLLNIIGLIEDFDSGVYKFNNLDIKNFNKKQYRDFRRNQVSFIFQNFSLLEEYNALKNITFPLFYQKDKRQDYIIEMAKKLEIYDLLHSKVYELSGGEKQRVAILRALITNPLLILADEPTGSLDEESRDIVLNILKSLNKKGQTIVIVTHDIDVAKKFNRIVELT